MPQLNSARLRLWHLVLALLAGFVALGAAIATTPVGAEWWSSFSSTMQDLLTWAQGLIS